MYPTNSAFNSEDRHFPWPQNTRRPEPRQATNVQDHTISVNTEELESWYNRLNDLCANLDYARGHVASVHAVYDEVELLRDEVYRHLRG